MRTIREPQRETPVALEPDVLVVGGGLTGVTAALAAARAGAGTLLVERKATLGGVTTAGLMASIGNTFFTAENHMVIRGLAAEFVERLVARGAASPDWRSVEAPGITLDPEVFQVVIIEALEEAGVRTLLLTQVAEAVVDGCALEGVIVQNSAGRSAILAGSTVDGTGAAEVAARAGAPCHVAEGNGSLEFRMAPVDIERFVDYFRQHPEDYPERQDRAMPFEQFERNWRERGIFFYPHGGGYGAKLFQQHVRSGEYETRRGDAYGLDAFGMYAYGSDGVVVINSNFFKIDLDPWAQSDREVQARKMVFHAADFLRKHIPGFERASVVAIGEEIGVRYTRWLDGEYTLTEEEANACARFADVIGVAPCKKQLPNDYGSSGVVLLADWFEIPYRCMLPKGVENLIVASGKDVSTRPRGLLRGMATCMVLGQAAGVAAALAAALGASPQELNITSLQRKLLEQGVYLGEESRRRELGLAT